MMQGGRREEQKGRDMVMITESEQMGCVSSTFSDQMVCYVQKACWWVVDMWNRT